MAFQRKKAAAIGVKAPFPGFVEPAQPTSIEKVPSGDRWIHEIKFDGYRVQLHIHNDAIKVLTRRGNGWTRRFSKSDRRLPDQRRQCHNRRRSGRSGSRRHHGFLRAAKRAAWQVQPARHDRF